MTKTNNGGGRSQNPVEIAIIRLRRISESQPTAWEGVISKGLKVHIAYLFGELSVEINRPVPGKPGFFTWETVAQFKPAIIQAYLDGKSEHERCSLRFLAERAILSELRRCNEADMWDKSKDTQQNTMVNVLLNKSRFVVRDGQLSRWLELRNNHLAFLKNQGVAGGAMPITARFD